MSRFAGRLWKWVVPAGITVGLLGLCAPAGADDEKEIEIKLKKAGIEKVEVKDGDAERKEGDRKEVKKDGERKEEGRKEEGQKKEARKGEGSGDARIDELTKIVKQLAGQVGELREELRGLRGGFAGGPNPEEMRKRMEEMAKKFAAANPDGANTEKYREEMERRFKAQQKERAGREGGVLGADAEAQIRREIERLNAQLKQISAAREREGGDKKEPKKEGSKDGGDKKDGDKKEDKKEDDK